MTKPSIDLTFLKYNSAITDSDIFDNFLSLGFRQVNESLEDVSSWHTAGGVILHVNTTFNQQSGIYAKQGGLSIANFIKSGFFVFYFCLCTFSMCYNFIKVELNYLLAKQKLYISKIFNKKPI